MPFVESIIAGLISVFAANQLSKELFTSKDPKTNEFVISDDDGKEIARIPEENVVLEPIDYFEEIVDRAESTDTKKQTKPNLTFENPYKSDVRIFGVSIVPNAGFKTKGKLFLTINERKLVEIDSTRFTDISSLELKIPDSGIRLLQGKSIKAWIWNGVDSTQVALTIDVAIGEI